MTMMYCTILERKKLIKKGDFVERFVGFYEYEGENMEHVIIEAEDIHRAIRKLNLYLEDKKSKQIQMGVSPFKSLEVIK